jgi:glycosyltransferase involved in cell wall biosynthesis
MNILFLTVSRIDNLDKRGIYTDLLRYFIKKGHKVHIVSPTERRFGSDTHLIEKTDYSILKVKTLNIQKTNIVEKGIGTVLLEYQYKKAISKYYRDIKFDLILYSTPPITLTRIIEKIKKKDNAKTYLLLKDIFPQNAVDIGMMSDSGILYKSFRRKEKKLYRLSDYIGCMSPANVDFLLKHNPEIDSETVEVCPNSVKLEKDLPVIDKSVLKVEYGIPSDATVFIYGGNLGKPQGLDFLLNVLETNRNKKDLKLCPQMNIGWLISLHFPFFLFQ